MSSFRVSNVLVAGGAGFIGSHTTVALIEAGYNVVVADNYVNSTAEAIARVRRITGCSEDRLRLVEVNLCDLTALEHVMTTYGPFHACIHMAGLKAVGESVVKPLLYYENNIISTLNLINMLDKYGCKVMLFSSSATVYGSAEVPITESTQTGIGITNAYGRTKYMIEEILKDFIASKVIEEKNTVSENPWRVTILRYFNPVGAHKSGLIGEDPSGIPNNLMPYVAQVAVGARPELTVFGNDYPTPDGTGVRDFIHVMDLASGHLSALRHLGCHPTVESQSERPAGPSVHIFNLGTGKGVSVLEMVRAMEKASGREIRYRIGPRRAGDIGVCYADCSAASRELGWTASCTLDDMCVDLWRWQMMNPNGFK